MPRRREILIAAAALAAPDFAAAQSVLGTQSMPDGPGPEAPTLDDLPAPGWTREVLVRWGDPVLPGAPPFNPEIPSLTGAKTQFGWDAIIAGIITPPPVEDGVRRLVLAVAHPDVWPRMAFPNERDDPRIAASMQGASILNLAYRSGRWLTVDGGYQSRRITDGTLCRLSGPAAQAIGHTVQGVLAPGIGCITPWNTILLPEQNSAPWIKRLTGKAPGYDQPGVGARFGWIVEIDALNPMSFPAKRTALGRLPRAGVACGLAADGTPVVFMSEAGPFGRLFRFKGTLPPGGVVNALDSGLLSVAMIEGEGITWQDLPPGLPSLTATASIARGGSRFDAPGGLAIGHDSRVYLACAGNRARGTDQIDRLNPRAGNGAGHIVALTPVGGDLGAQHFRGSIVLLGGDPRTDATARYTPGSTAWLRKPRTLSIDHSGNIYIGTDQRGDTDEFADGLFRLSVAREKPGAPEQVYRAPIGAAIGAAAFDPVSRSVLAAVRHPGATRRANFEDPATRWPTLRRDMPPQTTIVTLISPA